MAAKRTQMLVAISAITVRQVPLLVYRRRYSGEQLPTLTLFTKKHSPCSLCDEAKDVLKKYKNEFTYVEEYIDVPENREWFNKYKYDIPVLHLNGNLLMMHRVDEDKLRAALEELKNKS